MHKRRRTIFVNF